MTAALLNLVLQILLASLLGLLGLVFTGLAAALRLLPVALPAAVRLLRRAMLLSFRLYAAVLASVAPPLKTRCHVDIYTLPWRLLATVALSLCIGLMSVLVAGLPASRPILTICIVHGLLAGLQSSQPASPSGFQMGDRQ